MKTNSNTTSKILTLLLAAVTLALAARPASAGDQVPFKGRAKGAITSTTPGPDGVMLTVLAKGKATQLGKFTREEMVLLDPLTGTLTGDIVFTAANGDRLVCTFAGAFISPTTAAGTYAFTGGTGRFAHASGTADFTASTDDGTNFIVEFEGTLSSVGSNKP